MPTTETQVGPGKNEVTSGPPPRSNSDFQFSLPDSPRLLGSLLQGIRDWRRISKTAVPREYYQGEISLPVTEMRPWYRDFRGQIKSLFEKPTEPIGIFNRRQDKKRALCAGAALLAGAGAAWAIGGPHRLILGILGGVIVGEIFGVILFKKKEYPPDIWQEYKPQTASWINAFLVHAVVILALILPYYISQMLHPVKAKVDVVDISPYLPQLPPSAKKAGGGGGGGARTPTPPSKGKAPEFAKIQLAPPVVEMPKLKPQLPVQPTLLGPPELKLPQMANAQLGDPLQGVPGPPSQGPGAGSGIGTGTGTGIGSGQGGGLGPGQGAGTGGGPLSVGGNVSAPIPIYKPEPPYSEEARKAKYQGTVVLWIVVDTAGNVTDAQVVKPLGMGLDENALRTVKTWKFKPAMRNGAPVPVRVMVEVSFRLF
jgi:periplasmic protein TonB